MKSYVKQLVSLGAFALLVFGLSANVARAASGTINNDAWLRSTDGQPIFAHSGDVVKFGSTYYFYGEQYVGSQTYYQNGSHPTNNDDWVSTNVYTSTDLINWTPKVVAFNGGTYVQPGDWVGRCWGVLFNAATNRYVMWLKYDGVNGLGGLCLTSTSPTGPFTVDHLQTSVANIFSTPPICGDSKFFYAADGTPYLACSDSHGRQRAYVATLSSDYKTVNPVVQIATWPEGQEGNTALYAPTTSRYYYFTSETNGWSYSHAFVVNSTSVASGYTGRVILPGSDTTNTYWAQTNQAIKIPGTSGTAYVMLCDRWGVFSSNYASAGHGTGYNVWEPLTLSGSTATFNALATWQLDAAAGTWQSGGGGGSFPAAGTYSLRNRSSALMLDNLGSTTNGTDVAQWADGSSNNQRWVLSYISSNVVKLTCVTGSECLDGIGRTTSGSTVGQYASGSSNNQRWTIIDAGGGYFKLKNVATGLCLDVGSSPWPNGDIVQQVTDSTSQNQHWQFVAP